MMIVIAMLQMGRRIRYKPRRIDKNPAVRRAIHRLLLELRQDEDRPVIALEYIIPGELGKAEFDGFAFARDNDGSGRPVVRIDVPAEVADAGPEEPLEAVIGLARAAVEFGRGAARGRPPGPVFDRVLERLDLARVALCGRGPAPAPVEIRGPVTGSPRHTPPEPEAESEAVVEVTLPVSDQAAIDRAFQLEDALDAALTASGMGYVDGNDVGGGVFRIFARGPSLAALRDAVTRQVAHGWPPTNAELRSFTRDEDAPRATSD